MGASSEPRNPSGRRSTQGKRIMTTTRRQMLTSAIAAAAMLPSALRAQTPRALKLSITPSIFAATFQQLVTVFNAGNPAIHVSIEGRYRNQDDSLQATLRAALVGDLPDMAVEGNYYLPILRERGISTRLDDLIAKEKDWKAQGLGGTVQALGMAGGETHGLGVALSVMILYYNADLVAKAGGDPDNLPREWDGVLALAKKVGALGGTTEGGFYSYGSSFAWPAPVYTQGGLLMDAERHIRFTDREGLQALHIMRGFGEVGQAKYDVPQDQARTVFSSGVIGVLVDSSSSLQQFEQAAAGRFKIRTARFPLAPNGHIPASGIATTIYTKDPAKRAAAWEFMKFVSGVEGQTIIGKTTGYTPANGLAIEDPRYLGDHYAQAPNMAAANSSVASAVTLYVFPGENALKIAAETKDILGSVVTLKRTPEEGNAELEKMVRTLVPGAK